MMTCCELALFSLAVFFTLALTFQVKNTKGKGSLFKSKSGLRNYLKEAFQLGAVRGDGIIVFHWWIRLPCDFFFSFLSPCELMAPPAKERDGARPEEQRGELSEKHK